MKQIINPRNTGNVRRTASAIVLGAGLLATPLLGGCEDQTHAREERCDTGNISLTGQSYANALESMGASENTRLRRLSDEYICPRSRFAKNSQDVSWFRKSVLDLAESCSELGVPLWGFNKLQTLVYFDAPAGKYEFSVPVRERDQKRRQKSYEKLRDGLKTGIQALELGGSPIIVRLESISLDGDAIHVKAVAEPRESVAKQ
jgi:hypothetical protein